MIFLGERFFGVDVLDHYMSAFAIEHRSSNSNSSFMAMSIGRTGHHSLLGDVL